MNGDAYDNQEQGADYENPNSTLKRAKSSEMQDDYERADGLPKKGEGYETLRANEREKSAEYENPLRSVTKADPRHTHGHPAVVVSHNPVDCLEIPYPRLLGEMNTREGRSDWEAQSLPFTSQPLLLWAECTRKLGCEISRQPNELQLSSILFYLS